LGCPLSEANSNDGAAKLLVSGYISFTKYIHVLSAETSTSERQGKQIINYSGWYFWVTVLGLLAVGELGIAGTHPEPHPAACQHAWMGTSLQKVFHPCFMRCSY